MTNKIIALILKNDITMNDNQIYDFKKENVVKIIGNIAYSEDYRYNTILLEADALGYLFDNFYNNDTSLKTAIMRGLSNMTNTSPQNINIIIEDSGIFNMLQYCFNLYKDVRLILACIAGVNNMLRYADYDGVQEVINQELIIHVLSNIEKMQHIEKIDASVKCIKCFLARNDQFDNCVEYFKQIQGVYIIENAQNWINDNKILDDIHYILKTYYNAEEGKFEYIISLEEQSQYGNGSSSLNEHRNVEEKHLDF